METGLRIRAAGAARAVLRARGKTTQAGFTAEAIPAVLRRHPILLSDGPEHDAQRRELGRFLAPDVVDRRWGPLIEETAAAHVADAARHRGPLDMSGLSLMISVDVARQIVGLTESSLKGMARRLIAFQHQPPVDITRIGWGRTRRQWALAAYRGLVPLVRFHVRDVLPAIRSRQRSRARAGVSGSDASRDIVSHLVAAKARPLDILVECVTYGTAGMITTREFIVMAAWHLLSDPALAERYRAVDRPERLDILREIIRLEPVVDHLYRRVREGLEVCDGGSAETLAPGDLVDLCIREANADPEAAGPEADVLCPGRPMGQRLGGAGLSFGAGAHRCPGEHLALVETDAVLRRLLELSPRLRRAPVVEHDDVVAGYRLEGMLVDLTSPPDRRSTP